MTVILSIERDGVERARTGLELCIAAGGVGLFPADGLYGLACDPLNPTAIERINRIKGRDEGKPSAILYFSPLAMRELVDDLGQRTKSAVGALLPGPVTLVVANPNHRYPLACRKDPERLGVRLIAGPLEGMMHPIFQTSANHSGDPASAFFGDVPRKILAEVDVAVDAGPLTGRPSTVVDLTDFDGKGDWSVLREGGMPIDGVADRLRALT
ncbi:MAG: L-threonylcarbamoyladenylate synthase [Solirubrobacterales bacterium]|nr:L-threonylcarbamoyladenylate synthase [Solirubrobacterales bacterium]